MKIPCIASMRCPSSLQPFRKFWYKDPTWALSIRKSKNRNWASNLSQHAAGLRKKCKISSRKQNIDRNQKSEARKKNRETKHYFFLFKHPFTYSGSLTLILLWRNCLSPVSSGTFDLVTLSHSTWTQGCLVNQAGSITISLSFYYSF